jgi:hypothetical protein
LLTKTAREAKNETSLTYVQRKAIERFTNTSIEKDISHVEDVKRGIELEPVLIAEYAKLKGQKVQFHGKNQKRCVDEVHNTSSLPDGFLDDRVLDGKCPNLQNHLDNLDCASDIKWFISNRFQYWVQLQVHMWTASVEMKKIYDKCDFVSYCNHPTLDDSCRLFVTTIYRDDDFIEKCKLIALNNIELLNAEIDRLKKYLKPQ